jgi:crotonobetainyl-CoA:carnitine CoA-transferase CaiB-like acyl-CoA transferase
MNAHPVQDDTRLWRTGAENHLWKSTDPDMSAYFCAINRNKESITLNLKQEKGREILFRLVKNADVVLVTLLTKAGTCAKQTKRRQLCPGKDG